MKTNEGAFQYEHSLDHCLEFFSKAGSLYDSKYKSFYNNKEDILQLFQQAWIVDPSITFKLLLWVRDCRGGAGNRSGFRKCLNWLASLPYGCEWIKQNISLIPEYGRWDDLRSLFNTRAEKEAVKLWANALFDGNILAAKWADRKDIPLYLYLKKHIYIKNIGDFRRYLSRMRKDNIVEDKMCHNRWDKIDYEKVPSVAMSRYTNAFNLHDEIRFENYKKALKNGNAKINASVLFPHDCKRTVLNGDKEIADKQFDELPNYMKDKHIMVICDSSGSMCTRVSGSITAYDISTSLSLYCSGKLPKNNPFYKKFIQFESESKFTNWEGYKFSEAILSEEFFDGEVGSTRIDKALDLLLSSGIAFNVSDEQMPSMLLICSDMQFHQGTQDFGDLSKNNEIKTETEIESSLKKWDKEGYTRPQIVYWNIAPYDGQPETAKSNNVAMVSGFSPAILNSILSLEKFSPINIMMKALEKYDNIVKEIK